MVFSHFQPWTAALNFCRHYPTEVHMRRQMSSAGLDSHQSWQDPSTKPTWRSSVRTAQVTGEFTTSSLHITCSASSTQLNQTEHFRQWGCKWWELSPAHEFDVSCATKPNHMISKCWGKLVDNYLWLLQRVTPHIRTAPWPMARMKILFKQLWLIRALSLMIHTRLFLREHMCVPKCGNIRWLNFQHVWNKRWKCHSFNSGQ